MQYKCPDAECESTEIDIEITTWAYLDQSDPDNLQTDTDEAEMHDHEWDDKSRARCRECGYNNYIAKFEVDEDEDETEVTA